MTFSFSFRHSLPALAALMVAAGCPQAAPPASNLPPAGLAGAPQGAAKPSVHMMPGGHGGAAGNGAAPSSGNHPWAATGQNTAPAGHGGVAGPGDIKIPGTANKPELAGSIVEVQDVKEYTYVLVKRDDGTQDWAAVLRTPLQVGQRVSVSKEIWMSNFQSPSLNRTFDKILFGRLLSK